jgi:glycosyltransferase involved in cell wall biosynthesis
MKICFDGLNLALPQGSGIATYGRNIIKSANALGHETQVLYGPPSQWVRDNIRNEIAIVDQRRNGHLQSKITRYLAPRLSWVGRSAHLVEPTNEIIWPKDYIGRPESSCFWSSRDLFRHAAKGFGLNGRITPVRFDNENRCPDIMHWTCPIPLVAEKSIPNIYTIHDIIPLKLPCTTKDQKHKYWDMIQATCDNADHIVAVSESVKHDLISFFNVDEGRISVTYQSVDISKGDDVCVQELLSDVFDLEWKSYFLFYGAIEPKKNLARVLEAYLLSGTKTSLVVVGGRGWLDDKETDLLEQLDKDQSAAKTRIRRYEFLPRNQLLALVQGAKATLFPSLYEGFGLPVLEAMTLGSAVMTSTAGSLPEIAGDAALLVDPYDVEAMADAIRDLDHDVDLRRHLEAAGQLRATKFSQEAYQARLSAVYDSI